MKPIKTALFLLILFCLLFPLKNAFAAEQEMAALFTAPDASGSGTFENPMSLTAALTAVKAGQTIYMLEGTYSFNSTIRIDKGNDGTEEAYKTLSSYNNGKVTLDFSTQPYSGSSTGIVLAGSYWHIYGIKIYGAGDNGMLLSGNHNLIEMCVFEANRDSGLQLSRSSGSATTIADWPSYNYILNCTSFNNNDPATGENADGFAPKLTCGEGNIFNGCLSYNNVDDGWDCYAKTATGPIGVVTLINCIAFRNGQTETGVFTPNSDGNGFKLGGSGVGTPHIIINCLSFENKNCGFTDNNNPTALTLLNCTAFNNGLAGSKPNFNVYRCKNAFCINALSYSPLSIKDSFKNLSGQFILYKSGTTQKSISTYMAVDTGVSAKSGVSATALTAEDFILTTPPEIGADFHTLWRNANGSLNTNGFAMLKDSSAYYNFSSDGLAGGARFYQNDTYSSYPLIPSNVEAIVADALTKCADYTPTKVPTKSPTSTPTKAPTNTPTKAPTNTPTKAPTNTPTKAPTSTPTKAPTNTPTSTPVTVSANDTADSGSFILTLIIIAVAAILASAATTYLLLNKKNKH